MTSVLPYFAAALLLGYLLGSIPFGLIITRLAGTQDIRAIGSGNIGATNVLRTGRKDLAAATLAADMLKGTAAVILAEVLFGRDAALAAALGAFLGHLFPIWLKFNGGKGVATYIGLLLALAWPCVLVFCGVWLAVVGLTRYSSLAALIASAVTLLTLWSIGAWPEAQLFALITLLLWFKHRANIARLIKGSEDKIGQKSNAPPAA